jgi:hypothetical protein
MLIIEEVGRRVDGDVVVVGGLFVGGSRGF